MEYRALRRAHGMLENAGFAAVPVSYVALALARPSARDPSLALFTMAFVLFLVWRGRQSAASLAVRPTKGGKGKNAWPADELKAADRCFLKHSGLRALFDLLCFLVLLTAFDAFQQAGGGAGQQAVVGAVGAAGAVALVVAGAWVPRAVSWRAFASAHPALWAAAQGLNVGRNTRSPAAYFAWREGARALE